MEGVLSPMQVASQKKSQRKSARWTLSSLVNIRIHMHIVR